MDTTLQDPLIGHVLDGRYRVDERIAVGGMATVYRAVDTRLERELAVKVMHPSLADDEEFTERFIREAKSVARLDHQNIVGVLDQGRDGDYVYLAMEYVAGCTLRDLLRERGALAPRAVLDIMEPLLAGLGAAHRAGLVHRDIKPENVLIGAGGRVKVADFGLARGVDHQTSADTGTLLGTVSYLAPERIEHGTADQRADVYACGVLLYELLTGAKPHGGDSPAQVLFAHVHRDVPPPSEAVPGLAAALDTLVAKAAARTPRDRPADAVEMLALVRETRAGLTDEELDVRPPAAVDTPEAADGEEPTDRITPPPASASGVGPEDRTSVVPRPAGVRATAPDGPGAVGHTARIELPPEPADGGAPATLAARLPRRPVLLLIAAVLAVLGIGAGVWYVNSGQFVRTPGVYGVPQAEAEATLRDAGLDVTVTEAYHETVEAGHVISTDPARGDRVRKNATVTLTVSQGPPVATVPNLRGIPLEEAKAQLERAGLTPGEESHEFSAEVPRGSVLSTDPAAGTEKRPDAAVALVVSRGPQLDVPDVTGIAEGTAIQQLTEAGYEVEIAPERVFSEEESGTVAEQSPEAGEAAGEGDVITLTISKGQEMIVVPDVRGESEEEGRRILEDAGFEVNVNRLFFTGTIFNQSIYGGDSAARGSTITIWVR
ncbi:Stk1 family PASTA domain-containing Ser/Thr kinase [Streptomyces carpaticus]|uniref:non-specific serine/threonine protein kinase n=1 Tax=Streptomyces carpaticus TaxID=285558 RepID=A0ABV4ZU56_9ACTN